MKFNDSRRVSLPEWNKFAKVGPFFRGKTSSETSNYPGVGRKCNRTLLNRRVQINITLHALVTAVSEGEREMDDENSVKLS